MSAAENICPADGGVCEVAPTLPDADHAALLPCTRCRIMEACAAQLRRGQGTEHRSKSLGANERWVLAQAQASKPGAVWPYPSPGWPLAAVPATARASTAHARETLARDATRSLRKAGLIHSLRVHRRPQRLWRTALGERIVERIPPRGRIRWDQRLDDAVAAARLSTARLRTIYSHRVDMLAEMADRETALAVLNELDPQVVELLIPHRR